MSTDDAWNTATAKDLFTPPPTDGPGAMGASLVYGELEDEVPPFGDDLLAGSRAGLGYGEEEWALGRQEKVQVREKEGLTGVVFKHHSFLIASEVSRG